VQAISDMDRWDLDQSIEVASHLNLLKPDTCSAAKLAQNFRNLIRPGRAARLDHTCDRATAPTLGNLVSLWPGCKSDFGAKQTSTGTNDRLGRSKMTLAV
jgi:hypothetical protein